MVPFIGIHALVNCRVKTDDLWGKLLETCSLVAKNGPKIRTATSMFELKLHIRSRCTAIPHRILKGARISIAKAFTGTLIHLDSRYWVIGAMIRGQRLLGLLGLLKTECSNKPG